MNAVLDVCLKTTWLKTGFIVLAPFDIVTTHNEVYISVFVAEVPAVSYRGTTEGCGEDSRSPSAWSGPIGVRTTESGGGPLLSAADLRHSSPARRSPEPSRPAPQSRASSRSSVKIGQVKLPMARMDAMESARLRGNSELEHKIQQWQVV